MNEAKLTRELLEQVLAPAKERADLIDALTTIVNEEKSGEKIDSYTNQWNDFQRLVNESPIASAIVDEACDFLRPDAETMKREDLKAMVHFMGDEGISGTEEILSRGRQMDPEVFFRNRVVVQLEQFFRAGWEARGNVEQANILKRMAE
jgi:hypothetical protein